MVARHETILDLHRLGRGVLQGFDVLRDGPHGHVPIGPSTAASVAFSSPQGVLPQPLEPMP